MTLTVKAAGYIETGRVQVTFIYTIVAFIDICNVNKYVHIYVFFLQNIDAVALFTEPFTSAVLGPLFPCIQVCLFIFHFMFFSDRRNEGHI